jgi:hypothetical protein
MRAQAAKAPEISTHDQARTSADTGCEPEPAAQGAASPRASECDVRGADN